MAIEFSTTKEQRQRIKNGELEAVFDEVKK